MMFTLAEFQENLYNNLYRCLFINWNSEFKNKQIVDSTFDSNEQIKAHKMMTKLDKLGKNIDTLRKKANKDINLILNYSICEEFDPSKFVLHIDEKLKAETEFKKKINMTLDKLLNFFDVFYIGDYLLGCDIKEEKFENYNNMFCMKLTIKIYVKRKMKV